MDQVWEIAAQMELKQAEAIVTLANQVDDICANAQGVFQGHALNRLDSVEAICKKLKDKFHDHAFQKLTRVYSTLVNMGMPIPTEHDVAYFKATGDALGNLGIGNTTQPGAIGAGVQPTPTLSDTVRGGQGTPPLPQTQPLPGGQRPQPFPVPQSQPIVPSLVTGSLYPPTVAPIQPGNPGVGGFSGPPGDVVPPPTGTIDPSQIIPCPPGTYPYIDGNTGQTKCGIWSTSAVTVVGTVGPDCPPGFQWNPDPSSNAPSVDPIDPPIVTGWAKDCSGWDLNPQHGQISGFPCLSGQNAGGGIYLQSLCFNAAQLRPPQSGFVRVYYPSGTTLYVDSESGQIRWFAQLPPANWVAVNAITCDAADPGINPDAPPAPAGPGKCEPMPGQPPPEVCAPPPPFECPPPLNLKGIPGLAAGDDPCTEIQQWVDAAKSVLPDLTKLLTMAGEPGGGTSAFWNAAKAVIGVTHGPILPAMVQRFAKWANTLITDTLQGFKCDVAGLIPIALSRAGFAIIDKWTGIIPPQLTQLIEYASNQLCQSVMPGPGQADRAYLADTITDKQWECYQKSAGNYAAAMRQIRDADRTKVTPREVMDLLLRGYIQDDEASKKLRKLGVVYQDDEIDIRNLATHWPAFTDVVRFMVRDVFDEQAVQDSGFDEDFDIKYNDQAKKYGKAAGIPDEIAKLFWRAHWQMPSYTALREMLFRLRPDKYPEGMAVTTDIMEKTLKQDDWAPAFVKRMVEIAYRVVTPGDAQQMYMIHQFDEDTLKGYFLDNGYKPDDADAKVALLKRQRELRDLQSAGYPTPRRLQTLYANCQLDANTFEQAMQKWANSDEQFQNALEAADIMRSVTERKNAIKNVQKAYQLGLIDDATAASQLNQIGIDPGCIPELMKRIKQQKQKGNKHLSASQLCKMRDQHIITTEEQIEALQQVGWTYADAYRIAASCGIDNEKKHKKTSRRQTKERIVKTTGGKTTTTDETIDAATESEQ